jgi:hypothetical protein
MATASDIIIFDAVASMIDVAAAIASASAIMVDAVAGRADVLMYIIWSIQPA